MALLIIILMGGAAMFGFFAGIHSRNKEIETYWNDDIPF